MLVLFLHRQGTPSDNQQETEEVINKLMLSTSHSHGVLSAAHMLTSYISCVFVDFSRFFLRE